MEKLVSHLQVEIASGLAKGVSSLSGGNAGGRELMETSSHLGQSIPRSLTLPLPSCGFLYSFPSIAGGSFSGDG